MTRNRIANQETTRFSNGARVCGLALVGVILTACGGGGNEKRVEAANSSQSTPESAPGVTAPGISTGSPGQAVPSAVPPPSRENRANRATALGRLCWVEREVSQSAADLVSTVLVVKHGGTEPSPTEAATVVRQVKARLASASGALGTSTGLSAPVVAFRDGLDKSLVEAGAIVVALPDDAPLSRRKEAVDALTRTLNLEALPGAQQFADAARSDPQGCPTGA